jgi:hypothetical protein
MSAGKLITVDLGKGRGVQMYEEEAIRRGLVPASTDDEKKLPPALNKKRQPGKNKG